LYHSPLSSSRSRLEQHKLEHKQRPEQHNLDRLDRN